MVVGWMSGATSVPIQRLLRTKGQCRQQASCVPLAPSATIHMEFTHPITPQDEISMWMAVVESAFEAPLGNKKNERSVGTKPSMVQREGKQRPHQAASQWAALATWRERSTSSLPVMVEFNQVGCSRPLPISTTRCWFLLTHHPRTGTTRSRSPGSPQWQQQNGSSNQQKNVAANAPNWSSSWLRVHRQRARGCPRARRRLAKQNLSIEYLCVVVVVSC